VVLNSYLEWGVGAWPRLHGMFAIAIVDSRGPCPRLLLVRDRVGMKPLYYLPDEGRLVFGSEIKAILAWSGASSDVRIGAIRDYLALRYVPGPGTLLPRNTEAAAGHMATYQCSQLAFHNGGLHRTERAKRDRKRRGADQFGKVLRAAVRSHLIADVPVGAFLSGGGRLQCHRIADGGSYIGARAHVLDRLSGLSDRRARPGSADRAPPAKPTTPKIECKASDMSACPTSSDRSTNRSAIRSWYRFTFSPGRPAGR